MRIGNASFTTPRHFFTKMTEDELQQWRTAALLKGCLYDTPNDGQSFTVSLPTWYGKQPEKATVLNVGNRRAIFIYCDENDYSHKPGKEAIWIVRIL